MFQEIRLYLGVCYILGITVLTKSLVNIMYLNELNH